MQVVRILSLGLLIVTGVFASNLSAETLIVPDQFPTIQAAVDAAEDGDVVEVGVGLFVGNGNRDIRLHGKTITVRSRFGPKFTMIDAEGTPERPYRAFILDSGETTETVIEGFTICGGATLPGAIADLFNGGGILLHQSSATIVNCNIVDNQCGCWGAGVYCGFGASVVLIDCDISNNSADDDGGAIFSLSNSDITLVNCNLNDNYARVTGGAIASFSGGQVTVVNSNLINNFAPFGSAILGNTTTITNSIIWDNKGGDAIYQDWTDITYSIVQGGYEGIGNQQADPMFVDAENSDYRLKAASPAIDASDNTAIPDGVSFDSNGLLRFVDDQSATDTGIVGDQTAIADLGPTERQGPIRPTPYPMNLTITGSL